jgi:hypothetical protein
MTTKAPGYRRQKRTGKHDLAFVELNGKRHYLGPYDDPASRSRYHRLVGEWEATGRRPDVSPDEITVVELVAAYVRHATAYYVRQDGKPTSELGNVRRAVKPLRELYGRELANTFGPRHLKAVRQSFIDAGMCRRDCNRYAKMIRRVFKWGVSEGLVDANVHVALGTLDPLKRGRSEAWETEKIKPVADAVVEAVEPYVSRQVWALIRLQLLTAARPGELVGMRSCDIDRSGDVWVFAPQQHKTAYRDAERVVYLGPQAQQIISDFTFERAIDEPLFSPQDAERERAEKRRANRTAHPSVNKRRDAITTGGVEQEQTDEPTPLNETQRAILEAIPYDGESERVTAEAIFHFLRNTPHELSDAARVRGYLQPREVLRTEYGVRHSRNGDRGYYRVR